jgi:hypothetical protein
VLSDVWVREREQILDGEVNCHSMFYFRWLSKDLFILFSVFHICMPIHTQSSVQCYHKQEGSVKAIVGLDVLHLRFVLTIKSQVSSILGHHVDIWEGFIKKKLDYMLIGR